MKRIATIQDISCFGKCSLTVALPLISAMGIECCAVPTALLSTHTGGFSGYTFRDLSDEITPIGKHWSSIGLHLDAIYTGYLGSEKQIDLVKDFIKTTESKDTMIFVDPAMADNGILYNGFGQKFPQKMLELCRCADVICPNITEAALMLGTPYRPSGEYDEKYIRSLLSCLASYGIGKIILTGVSFSPDTQGAVAYDSEKDEYFSYFGKNYPMAFHGTGDTFSSVLCASLVLGADLLTAIKNAVDFTVLCIEETLPDLKEHFYGVRFESCIPKLCQMAKNTKKQ